MSRDQNLAHSRSIVGDSLECMHVTGVSLDYAGLTVTLSSSPSYARGSTSSPEPDASARESRRRSGQDQPSSSPGTSPATRAPRSSGVRTRGAGSGSSVSTVCRGGRAAVHSPAAVTTWTVSPQMTAAAAAPMRSRRCPASASRDSATTRAGRLRIASTSSSPPASKITGTLASAAYRTSVAYMSDGRPSGRLPHSTTAAALASSLR
jgi:hypothetical protein